MNRFRATPRPFLLLLLLVAVYRCSLLGRGAMSFVDEQRYYKSVLALQQLRAGDLRGAAAHIADTSARPGAAMLQLPVAALQGIPYALGISPSNPRSLLIPQAANVAVSLVTLCLFFQICLVLCGDDRAALAASLLYALLVNSNIYLRHLLPYDWALAIAVLALWLPIVRRRTPATAAVAGALAGAAATIYPGYAPLSVIAALPMLGLDGWSPTGPWLARGASFAAGALAVIGGTELLCRAGGIGLLEGARTLGATITQGAFDEGWTFFPEYLISVERASGAVLLGAAAIYLWRAIPRVLHLRLRAVDWLVLPAAGAWMFQAASSAVLHQTVLYGRLIHPWLFFLCLALADTLASIENRARQAVACVALGVCAAVSWAPAAWNYYRLAYPADVLYSQGIDTARVPADRFVCEFDEATPYRSPAPLDRTTNAPYTTAGDTVLLLNFCQGAPGPRETDTEAGPGPVLFDGPHFLTFPAYGFEGFAPAARRALDSRGYRVRVFSR